VPVITEHHTEYAPTRPRPSHKGRWRLYAVGILFALAMAGVIARLFVLQVVKGEEYAELAQKQYESKAPLQADRGTILDRNGTLLATNIPALSFAVDPNHIEEPEILAEAFAESFGGDVALWRKKIAAENTSFVWIKRKVVGEAINRMKEIDDAGLITISEPLRRFEYGSYGAQVVGCVNLDNDGLSGVELFYNTSLRGLDGYMVMQRDALGRRRPDIDLPLVDPQHGENLQLTIDIIIQSIVEDELARGIKSADATTGTALALDPRTGEILAMASLPSFDPNTPGAAEQSNFHPRGITNTYEPGSTIKGIIAAAALEEGLISPDELIDGEGGEYHLTDDYVIRDDHPLGLVSFADAFRWSSNIIFAKVAGRLDRSTFYKYVRDFGFGVSTGIDLPGEVRGEVKKPEEFSEGTQEFMAYGYQIAVTPLQLAVAYAAIANGGVIVRPHILKGKITTNGGLLEETESQGVRRVISEETAATICRMLIDVVENGTGRIAQTTSIPVAGKTGTAQILHEGSYGNKRYNASFIGFFPADDPEVVLLVLLSEPKNGYYGGRVAAPIFSSIAKRVINVTMVNREPELLQVIDETEDSNPVESVEAIIVPDMRGLDNDAAIRMALSCRLKTSMQGMGKRVLAQHPAPGEPINRGEVIYLNFGDSARMHVVPDVRGMTTRRALAVLNEYRLQPSIVGTTGGVIGEQRPLPGTRVSRNEHIRLQCQ